MPHAVITEEILQSESLIPQNIIVGIKNNRGTRRRDLSSGKENFMRFIKDEVFNLVRKHYRTSGHRTLFGHSMAGAFTMNVLASEPGLFTNYIAASPTIQSNNSELITKYQNLASLEEQTQKSLYFTFGDESAEGKNASEALEKFLELMKNKKLNKLMWRFSPLSEQVHMTTPSLTLYAGLSFAFSDYKAPSYTGFKDYTQQGGWQGLKTYYNKRAKKYSEPAEIPDTTFINLGFAVFDDGHESEGLEILKRNAQTHPNSLRALNALAQTYEDLKKPRKALEIYKKALFLADKLTSSNLTFFKKQVERLERS